METLITFNYVDNGCTKHMEFRVINDIPYNRIYDTARKVLTMKHPNAAIVGDVHFVRNGYSGNVRAA